MIPTAGTRVPGLPWPAAGLIGAIIAGVTKRLVLVVRDVDTLSVGTKRSFGIQCAANTVCDQDPVRHMNKH